MLEAIRKRSASFVVKLLLLLLVLSFGLWGIGDVLSPNPQNEWAAKVGDVAVPNYVLRDEYQNELRRLRQVLGNDIDRERARDLGLPQNALSQIVNRTLLDLGAADLGVVASDNVVRQTVQANPVFRNQQGSFDKQVFDNLIRNSGLTEVGYLDTVRGDLVRGQFVNSILAGAAAPRQLLDELYRYRNEKRVVTYMRIENATMTELAGADETALRAFHGENASLFTAPEYRSVTALILNPKDLTAEISISREELETAFQERFESYGEPERRTLEQMTFTDEQAGQLALGRISGGADFATVAQENAGLDANAIQLGTVSREQVLPELADAAFQLPEGAVSNLIESPLGWHLIQVTSIQPAQRRSLDEVGDQLTKELANERAIDALIDLSARLEDALAGGATLEEAASQIGLKPLKIEALDSNGLDPEGKQVGDLPQGFVDTAFSTSENTESPLVEADRDGGYFVVRVDKVTPASPKPFEVARTEVEQAWAAVKRSEAAEVKAKAIARGIEEGASFSAAAAEQGLTVNTSPPISRSGEGASVDLEMALIRSAFQTQPEKVFVATGQNAAFVASVTDVIAADPASETQKFDALARDTQATEQNDMLSQLTQGLTKQYPVEINAQAVEQLY